MVELLGVSGSSSDDPIQVDSRVIYYYDRPDYNGTLNKFGIFPYYLTYCTCVRGAVFLSSNRTLVAQSDSIVLEGTLNEGSFEPSSINANTDYILALWISGSILINSTDEMEAPSLLYSSDTTRNYGASGNGNFAEYLNPLDSQTNYSTIDNDYIFYVYYDIGIGISTSGGVISSGGTWGTLAGQVTYESGTAWFYWGDDDGGEDRSGWDYSSNAGTKYSGNSFTYKASGLETNTKYYYRCYISSNWKSAEDWSDVETWTTNDFTLSDTPGMSASGGTWGTLTGKVDNLSGTTWFYYGTSDGGETKGRWDSNSNLGTKYNEDTFTERETGLTPDTDYHYRIYISSNWGPNSEKWSSDYTFHTRGPIEVTNADGCISSGLTTATVEYKMNSLSGNIWIYYESGTAGGGTDISQWDESSNVGIVYEGTESSTQLTGLTSEWIYSYRTYVSSNGLGAGDDWAPSDIEFTTTSLSPCNKDLKIYYSSLTGNDFICCNCSRWDTQDYNIVIETLLTKSQLQTLRNNITPGATGELYQVLGKPHYYDQTWNGENTLKLHPNQANISTLPAMREEKLIYVKNLVTNPIEGSSGLINVKIEGYISGSTI
jgi:hypothetical protein